MEYRVTIGVIEVESRDGVFAGMLCPFMDKQITVSLEESVVKAHVASMEVILIVGEVKEDHNGTRHMVGIK